MCVSGWVGEGGSENGRSTLRGVLHNGEHGERQQGTRVGVDEAKVKRQTRAMLQRASKGSHTHIHSVNRPVHVYSGAYTHTHTHTGTYLLIDHLHNVGEVKEGSYVLALPHFLPQQLVEAQVCVVGVRCCQLVSVNTPHSCRQPLCCSYHAQESVT